LIAPFGAVTETGYKANAKVKKKKILERKRKEGQRLKSQR
jgi:hypothetical protein